MGIRCNSGENFPEWRRSQNATELSWAALPFSMFDAPVSQENTSEHI
jgi:hypothetical protein